MGVIERKEREKEQRRNDILKAGEHLFSQNGIKNTTMEQIANACEISRGTLYLYFNNKEELFNAIVIKGIDILIAMMKEKINNCTTVNDKLAGIGRAYLGFYKEYRNYYKFLSFMDEQSNIECNANDAYIQTMEKSQDLWTLIVDVIQQGIDEGQFRKDTNPYEVALVVWSASNGIIGLFDHIIFAHKGELPKEMVNHSGVEHLMEFSKVNLETLLMKLWDSIFHSIRNNETI